MTIIKDNYGLWIVNKKLLKDLYVRTSKGFIKATPNNIIKGRVLRRATGGTVLYDKDGKPSDKFIHVEYFNNDKTEKEEPYEMTIDDHIVAYRIR